MLMSGLVIDREVLIEAPAEVVWRTITEPDQITQWFASRVELVVEPGGAVGLAALLAGRIDVRAKNVVIVLSGGNVDADLFARLVA